MADKNSARPWREGMKSWKFRKARKMARNMTLPERLMWDALKSGIHGVSFYKQEPMYGYIVDFWCPKARLVVEVDGPMHEKQRGYDRKRDKVMEDEGLAVLRFSDGAVKRNLAAVRAVVSKTVAERLELRETKRINASKGVLK